MTVLFIFISAVVQVTAAETTAGLRENQIGVLYLTTFLTAAHIAAPEDYSIQTDTLSSLGGQNYENAWIMNSGFAGFGGIMIYSSSKNIYHDSNTVPLELPIALYGVSMAGAGIFSSPSFQEGSSFDSFESSVHTFFANSAGISLTGAMLVHAILEDDSSKQLLHYSAVGYTALASGAFKMFPEYQGVWQRALWVGGLSWLTFVYNDEAEFAISTTF
jgi:hypothetical membrane protein